MIFKICKKVNHYLQIKNSIIIYGELLKQGKSSLQRLKTKEKMELTIGLEL